jgi:hypothetical protein
VQWSLVETKTLVRGLYGLEQQELASASANSAWRRIEYARTHCNRAEALLTAFKDQYLRDTPLIVVAHGQDENAREAFERLMIETGAELVACVQSLHAMGDIMAHAVYFGLGLNRMRDPLDERQIGVRNVLKKAKKHKDAGTVRKKLSQLAGGAHLAALCNKAKHSEIIAPALSEDWSGVAAERHALTFPGCKYGGKTYPQVYAIDFLAAEFNRCGRLYVEAGCAINDVLRARCVRANLATCAI